MAESAKQMTPKVIKRLTHFSTDANSCARGQWATESTRTQTNNIN